jgi:RNA polymerase sigma factor (sigma-70 family)
MKTHGWELDSTPPNWQACEVEAERNSSRFDTTHWSVVLRAGGDDALAATVALERLCNTYWYPLYAHVRRRGYGPDDGADLTQEFFAMLLRRHSFTQVAREKGRFRTFLLTSLDYFLHDQRARAHAAKRGGGVAVVALDAMDAEQRYALEPRTEETPDKAFDRRWAAALLEQAFSRLNKEQAESGKGPMFARLQPLLGRPVESGEYEVLAEELGVPANTIAKTVQRLRQRARELLFEEAKHTVATQADADRELRELFG